jgi:hypothetical protein
MQRLTYCGVIAAVLVALVATPIHSQQGPRTRVTRRGWQPAEVQSERFWMDPNMTPEQQFARHQQEMQQRMAEMQAQIEQMHRQAEQRRNKAIQQMLNATDEQWQRIKPQLDRIDRLKAEANVSAELGSSGGAGATSFQSGTASGGAFMGGWMAGGGTMDSSGRPQTWSQSQTFGSPSGGASSTQKTDGQVLCDQLLHDLQTPGTPPQNIAQRVAALRRIRTQAQTELAQARNALRAAITPPQEPALVVMGYLD